MALRKPRRADVIQRIAEALHYLQGEARAAALDDVALAINHAEHSVHLCRKTRSTEH